MPLRRDDAEFGQPDQGPTQVAAAVGRDQVEQLTRCRGTVFGQVIGGMDVVDRIGNVPVGDNGPMPGQTPVTPILIKRIAVVK